MNTTERDFSAHEILDTAGKLLGIRGVDYDSEGGERSGASIAAAFNAIKGKKILEAGDVYLIHDLTKKVRQESAAGYHIDSGDDATAYAALTAEAKAEDGRREKHGMPSLADVAVRGSSWLKPIFPDESKSDLGAASTPVGVGDAAIIGNFDDLVSDCKHKALLLCANEIIKTIENKKYKCDDKAKKELADMIKDLMFSVAGVYDK